MDAYNYIDNIEDEFQNGNDLICEFLGGIIETTLSGQQWRIDQIGTPFQLMKCAPFGVVARCGEDGKRIMQFHNNYNWLMPVIKECELKANTDALKAKYSEICSALVDFNVSTPISFTHFQIVEFIKLFNEQKVK